jgi:dTDP-4-amino-4,6-dideoxygalactose transaminase
VTGETRVREEFLSFSPPAIGEAEINDVVETLRSDWITTGPKVSLFERRFREYVDAPAAVAVSSGTAALHLALLALDIGPGDRVVTTPMTFCSTVHVIEHSGAQPVLVDIEPDSLNIDSDLVESVVAGNEARVILPVHLYGQPCDLDRLLEISRRHGCDIVEDAAHALPAQWGSRLIGSSLDPSSEVRNLTAFSFYATKNLTTAEGGMLTGPPDLIDRARLLSLHGMSHGALDRYTEGGSWYYEVVAAGFKYNMTDIQAALGIGQLQRLDLHQARRREVAARYSQAFSALEAITLPTEKAGRTHAWHIYAIRLNLDMLRIDRARFISELRALNIGSSVHFIPVHLHPYYRDRYGWRSSDFPVASREYERLVSLPLHPRLTDRDADDVVDAVNRIVKRNRR